MLFEWFIKGGLLMWPLLLCSIIGLAVIIERLVVLRPALAKIKSPALSKQKAFQEKFSNYSKNHPVWLIENIFSEYKNKPETIRNQALLREGQLILNYYRKNLNILLSISNLAPLLGLLGTVLGLVKTFQSINNLGQVPSAELIAGGMWEALITTVAGLTIGIPCLLAYQCLLAVCQKMSNEMEEAESLLSETVALNNYSQELEESKAYAN